MREIGKIFFFMIFLTSCTIDNMLDFNLENALNVTSIKEIRYKEYKINDAVVVLDINHKDYERYSLTAIVYSNKSDNVSINISNYEISGDVKILKKGNYVRQNIEDNFLISKLENELMIERYMIDDNLLKENFNYVNDKKIYVRIQGELIKNNITEKIDLKYTFISKLRKYVVTSVMNSKWVHYTRPNQAFFSPCLFS